MNDNRNIVSFENERLILVDSADNILGYKSKAECHDGEGILHRAFSIFIFSFPWDLVLRGGRHESRTQPRHRPQHPCRHRRHRHYRRLRPEHPQSQTPPKLAREAGHRLHSGLFP